MLSLYQLFKLGTGAATAMPLFYVTRVFFMRGQMLLAVALLIVSLVSFWLPGFLLDRYIKTVSSLPGRLKQWFVDKFLAGIPFVGRGE